MTDPLSPDALMAHVHALARDIGPRPPGHPAEARAREYVRRTLADAGILGADEQPFSTWDTWGYMLLTPLLLSLAGNALGRARRWGRAVGGLASLLSAFLWWRITTAQRQPLSFLYPKRPTANTVARIPPTGGVEHRVVLVGHTDTNKHRGFFSPARKRFLLTTSTLGIVLPLVNGLAQLAQAAGAGCKTDAVRRASLWALASFLPVVLHDETGGHIPGANDNASAVACLLGLGTHLKRHPLRRTEVWLAFTGAEEVGCLGMHALLDAHGSELVDAWFVDFEMVGARDVAYVTRHSSLTYLGAYAPDDESLALARETRERHPALDVRGRPMVILEEVSTLRRRGYRGICLAGVAGDGWLPNWHRHADDVDAVEAVGLARAARFALAMMQTLDERSPAGLRQG